MRIAVSVLVGFVLALVVLSLGTDAPEPAVSHGPRTEPVLEAPAVVAELAEPQGCEARLAELAPVAQRLRDAGYTNVPDADFDPEVSCDIQVAEFLARLEGFVEDASAEFDAAWENGLDWSRYHGEYTPERMEACTDAALAAVARETKIPLEELEDAVQLDCVAYPCVVRIEWDGPENRMIRRAMWAELRDQLGQGKTTEATQRRDGVSFVVYSDIRGVSHAPEGRRFNKIVRNDLAFQATY